MAADLAIPDLDDGDWIDGLTASWLAAKAETADPGGLSLAGSPGVSGSGPPVGLSALDLVVLLIVKVVRSGAGLAPRVRREGVDSLEKAGLLGLDLV